MALKDSDLLAVYRETDQQNYKTTVAQLVSRVPAPSAPSLTAVLENNNVSKNIDIIIQDANTDAIVTLSASGNSVFANDVTVKGGLSIGVDDNIILQGDGEVDTLRTNLIGDINEGKALVVYASGTELTSIGGATEMVTITNTGEANFAGFLEADRIDGGVYSVEDPES